MMIYFYLQTLFFVYGYAQILNTEKRKLRFWFPVVYVIVQRVIRPSWCDSSDIEWKQMMFLKCWAIPLCGACMVQYLVPDRKRGSQWKFGKNQGCRKSKRFKGTFGNRQHMPNFFIVDAFLGTLVFCRHIFNWEAYCRIIKHHPRYNVLVPFPEPEI